MTFKEILEITRKRMNKEKYNKKIIFPNGKAGMIQKAIEIELVDTFKECFPNAQIDHPEDNSGLPDLWSYCYNHGIEIKTTKGWPSSKRYRKRTNDWVQKPDTIVWTQGTVQDSDIKKPFIFIKFSIINNTLEFDRVYFGLVSYNDWNIHFVNGHEKDMRMPESIVKKLCKQII